MGVFESYIDWTRAESLFSTLKESYFMARLIYIQLLLLFLVIYIVWQMIFEVTICGMFHWVCSIFFCFLPPDLISDALPYEDTLFHVFCQLWKIVVDVLDKDAVGRIRLRIVCHLGKL